MFRSREKPINKRTLFIRFYVLLLSSMLLTALFALLTQSVCAKTYVIRDGERVVTYTSFATDPAEILDQAGVALSEYDTFTTAPVEGAEAITITRANSITIHYHGQTTVTSSNGETAGELLKRLKMDVSGEDVVSHGMEDKTYDGMEISIDHVVKRRETYTAVLPHEVQYCSDAALPEGTEQILLEGEDGELLCTAEITYVNGVESERTILSRDVTQMPVTEIIGIGTGEAAQSADPDAMPEIADGYIKLPTGEVLTYTDTATIRATAYTHTDEGCDFITSTGSAVRRGTVAVDPRYIPYGTRMFIVASNGSYVYGLAVAADCGGDIKGDRMDLYMPTYEECREFGRRACTIYFLG